MLREIAHCAAWSVRHLRGQLKPREFDWLVPLIEPGDVCLDIGAHAGSWLLPLGRRVGRNGAVIGVEALPYYARVLRMTVFLIGSKNIRLLNRAVTEDGRSVRMIWQDPSGARLTGRTHIAGKSENAAAGVEIDGTTIDRLCADVTGRVSFMKLDIEGAELGALRGGTKTLGAHRPIVFTEVVEEHLNRYGGSTQAVFDFFRGLNYRAFSMDEDGVHESNVASAASHNDLLFVPEESVARVLASVRSPHA